MIYTIDDRDDGLVEPAHEGDGWMDAFDRDDDRDDDEVTMTAAVGDEHQEYGDAYAYGEAMETIVPADDGDAWRAGA